MPLPLKSFYMIRHGETEANAAKIMAGSIDSPLTERGREQAYSLHNVFSALDMRPDVVIHSNLSRARDTALIINEYLNLDIKEDPDLAELHAGDWEGVPYADCRPIMDDWVDPPGGERFDDFFARLKRAKSRTLEAYAKPLLVCHGGVMRGFGGIYGIMTPGLFQNCHLYEFQPSDENTAFPWAVWQYDEVDGEIVRTRSTIYDSAQDSIAS